MKNDIQYGASPENYISLSKEISKYSGNYPEQIASSPTQYIVDFTQNTKGSILRFNFIKKTDKTFKSQGYLAGDYTKQ